MKQIILFIFWSGTKTKKIIMFINHSPSEILSLNFEKTVFKNYNFPIEWSTIITLKRIQWHHLLTSFSVWTQLTSYVKHEFENLKAQNARAAY